MIRQLGAEEFARLYRERIRADFPRMERRPLRLLRRLHAQGRCRCLVLEEEGRIAAYASFLLDEAVGGVLLDHFAVDRALRGTGIGSRFLASLRDCWSDRDGILVECEQPDSAKTPEERHARERRIRFYERGGAQTVPLRWRAFGVDYRVLWLPIRRSAEQSDAAADLLALYTLAFPPALAKLLAKATAQTEIGKD